MSRCEYEMSEKQLESLLEAIRPQPVIYGTGGTPLFRSQQERANGAWISLGNEMGFDGMTVQPVHGKNDRFFTAVPKDMPEEAEEHKCPKCAGTDMVASEVADWYCTDCGRTWCDQDLDPPR